jgi:hypothetical protein
VKILLMEPLFSGLDAGEGPWRLLFFSCALLLVIAVPASAATVPQPHHFFGMVTIDDIQAPAGTTVEASAPGVISPIVNNPVTVEIAGYYGTPSGELSVEGIIANGTPLRFFVNGSPTEVFNPASSTAWAPIYPFASGEVTELDLRVITSVPNQTANATVTTLAGTVTTGTPPVAEITPGTPDGAAGTSAIVSTGPEVVPTAAAATVLAAEVTGTQIAEAVAPFSVTGSVLPTPPPVPFTLSLKMILGLGVIAAIVVLIGIAAYIARIERARDKEEE